MIRTAYLIDPWTRTVEEVERAAIDAPCVLREIHSMLHCANIQAVRPHNAGPDVMYLDEDGHVKDKQAFFHCRDAARLCARTHLMGRCSVDIVTVAVVLSTVNDGRIATSVRRLQESSSRHYSAERWSRRAA